jgi:hypothetical protein
VHAYEAQKPYEQPSMVMLAHPPVPHILTWFAVSERQTDVLTATCDGQTPPEHQSML